MILTSLSLKAEKRKGSFIRNGYGHDQEVEDARTGRYFEIIDDIENRSEDEGLEDYKKGGYHTVHVG